MIAQPAQPRKVNPVLGNRFLIKFEDLEVKPYSVEQISEFELVNKPYFYFFNRLVWNDATIILRDFYEENVQREVFDSYKNGGNFNFYYYILYPEGHTFNAWYVNINKINSVYTEKSNYKNDRIFKTGLNFSIKEIKDLNY